MNERIQELHEQAMKSCDEHRSDILNYHRIYREKFAELIVKECFSKLEPYLDDQFIDDIESELKEHFGVDE